MRHLIAFAAVLLLGWSLRRRPSRSSAFEPETEFDLDWRRW